MAFGAMMAGLPCCAASKNDQKERAWVLVAMSVHMCVDDDISIREQYLE